MSLVEKKPGTPPGLTRWAPLMNDDADGDIELPIPEYPSVNMCTKVESKNLKMPKFIKPKTKNCKKKTSKSKAEDEEFEETINGEKDEKSWISENPTNAILPLIADMPKETQFEVGAEIHAFTTNNWKFVDPMTGWTRVRAVVDSGASDSCASDEMAPMVASRESAGSRRGLTYSGAAPGGKPLTNNGEKEIFMMTNEGAMLGTCWQTVEVARPLLSVRQITQQGNRVTFGAIGGEIRNLASGKVVPFSMEGNVYVLDLWTPPAAGFTRQG